MAGSAAWKPAELNAFDGNSESTAKSEKAGTNAISFSPVASAQAPTASLVNDFSLEIADCGFPARHVVPDQRGSLKAIAGTDQDLVLRSDAKLLDGGAPVTDRRRINGSDTRGVIDRLGLRG